MVLLSLLGAWWAKFLGFIPQVVDVVMKHWQKFLVLGMAFIIYNQNFMEFQALKWFGIQTIPAIEKKLVKAEEAFDNCVDEKNVLEAKIVSVNDQIDQWADVSSVLQQNHNDLLDEIIKMRKKSEKAVADILAGPTPETCDAAIEYLRESVTTSGEVR